MKVAEESKPTFKRIGRGSIAKSSLATDAEALAAFMDCGDAWLSSCSRQREREKKRNRPSGDSSSSQCAGGSGDSLAAFYERLRDVCQDHGACHGQDREHRIRAQAEQALALAGEFGLLIEPGVSWAKFLALCSDPIVGTEHMVELDTRAGLVGKTTIPPAFGLVPDWI